MRYPAYADVKWKRMLYMPTTKAQQEEILRIFREADEDQGGSLDFYEFLHLLRRFVDDSGFAQGKRILC